LPLVIRIAAPCSELPRRDLDWRGVSGIAAAFALRGRRSASRRAVARDERSERACESERRERSGALRFVTAQRALVVGRGNAEYRRQRRAGARETVFTRARIAFAPLFLSREYRPIRELNGRRRRATESLHGAPSRTAPNR
jgi:hypothetical protein